MKRHLRGLIVILLLSVSSTQGQTETKAEVSVALAAEKLRLAMIDPDEKELNKILAKKLSYGQYGGYVENKTEFIKMLMNKQPDFVGISTDDEVISVTRKTAIVRHIFSAQTKDNNNPGRVKLKVMLVFIKISGHWKLLARQAVKPS